MMNSHIPFIRDTQLHVYSHYSFSHLQLIGYNEKPISLQMFIGTADERYIRPHPFYQVHRITGKTVATPSQETVISCTKVLEIPLLPESNMCARYLSNKPLIYIHPALRALQREIFCINDILTWLTVQSLDQEDGSSEWKICEIQNRAALFLLCSVLPLRE